MVNKSPLVAALLLFSSHAFTQPSLNYYLPTTVSYDTSIPTPQSYFGFQVGEWHLTPDQIHAYLKVLASASKRMSVQEFGTTYEHRPMMLLTVTSPDNLGNLESIRTRHLQLSDPAASASLKTDEMPVVVWMGYSVHGNEPSGSNASVLVAYYMAAAQGPEIDQLLQHTVILMNPSINPDGLNRFATWANMHRGRQPVADPGSREHMEVWPGGRTNHYWFDLNRDWMPVQLPETQGRLEQYYAWRPNVLTDHHEMGTNSTFFFQPGVAGRDNPLTPPTVRSLTQKIGSYHAQALDQIGSLYYSEEGYDDFYVGKGSSYPDITGGIGILFEQASSRGHLQESSYGPLSFPFTIRNQVTASLSTLKAVREMRKELLDHQRSFTVSSVKEAEQAPVKGYIFGSKIDPYRNSELVSILLRHRINIHSLTKAVTAGGTVYEPGWAYVVPATQPQYRLLTSLFEQRTRFQDSLFYDISAWTLPYAFGLPFMELRSLDRSVLGPALKSPPFITGAFSPGKKDYAYVFEWHVYHAPRALYRLLQAGVKARVASRAFDITTTEGRHRFSEGSILVPLGIQAEKTDVIKTLLTASAKEDGLHVYVAESGLSTEGLDLGSSAFSAVELPVVALLAGPGVSSNDVGEAWHLLDQRMHMPVTLLDPELLGRSRLNRYTAIVMVAGSYSPIDSSGKDALRRWIGEGGTLIVTEQAVQWAVQNKFATAKLRTEERSKKDSVVQRRPYANEMEFNRAVSIPGSIFDVRYDRTHPLMYGYGDSPLRVFRSTTVFLDPSTNPYATPVQYTEKPLLSGYLHKQHEPLVKNSAAVLVSAFRSGRVILMTDNPNFRAFWFGTSKLFLNGIFFGSTIRQSSARQGE